VTEVVVANGVPACRTKALQITASMGQPAGRRCRSHRFGWAGGIARPPKKRTGGVSAHAG
jgi:hypothetical protein